MDRRSPFEQPPVPGVDDERTSMQRQPISGRGPNSRSVSPHSSSIRSREISGDRDRDRQRRRSKTPDGRLVGKSLDKAAVAKESSRSRVEGKDSRSQHRDHRDRLDRSEGSSSKARSERKPIEAPKDKERDKERVEKRSSTSKSGKDKEKVKEPEAKDKEKEKRRESSESDSKKVKEKAKKKKKTTDKEKKKSKRDKKEKKSKNKTLTEEEKQLAEQGGTPTKREPIEQVQPTDDNDDKGNQNTNLLEDKDVPMADPEPSTHSTPRQTIEMHEPKSADDDVLKLNETLESSSSPSHENPSDSVLDIYGNIDYELELEDMTENRPKELREEREAKEPSKTPVLSKWEREDEDNEEKSGSNLNDTQVETPEDGEIDDDNKVTNEVLKRAEHALFSRAINAIRPLEIRGISSDRKKLYADPKEPTELLGINKRRSQSPELKQNVQVTVATKRSASRERCVEVVEKKLRQRSGSKEKERRGSTPVANQEKQDQRKLPIKERLGVKVDDERSGRRRSPSPVRKVKITGPIKDERGDRGASRGRGNERDRGNNNERGDRDKERQRESDRNRKRSPIRVQEQSEGGRNRSPVRGQQERTGRTDDRGRGRQGEERRREPPREVVRDRAGHSRDNPTNSHGRTDRGRDAREHSQLRNERDRDNRGNSQLRGDTNRRDRDRGQARNNRPDPTERKRSRTISPNRDLAKKTKREEHDQRKGKNPIDEANFEPDYEHMDIETAKSDERHHSKERKPILPPAREEKPKRLVEMEGTSVPAKKAKGSPASSSSDSSSDSSSSDGEVDEDGETKRKSRKKSKHSKKSKKTKRGTSSDSEDRGGKKSKKSKSKKSKKKKKHKHK